jgi:hypothetical protein
MQGLSNKNSGDAYSSLLANPTAYNLKMKVPSLFHMSVTIYQPTECHIPEDLNLHAQNYFVCCDFVPNPEYSILTLSYLITMDYPLLFLYFTYKINSLLHTFTQKTLSLYSVKKEIFYTPVYRTSLTFSDA